MAKKEYEMPDEYKQHLAKLAEFYADRERFGKALPDAPPHMAEEFKRQLRKMDDVIENMERMLAEEYERHQAEMAKEAQIEEAIKKGWDATLRIYLMTKHKVPHLLDKFTTQCLAPLTPEEREQFLDEAAILETHNLDAILKGKE